LTSPRFIFDRLRPVLLTILSTTPGTDCASLVPEEAIMRVELTVALLAMTVPIAAAQRGGVKAVSAAVAPAGSPTEFTVSGTNPCSSVRVAYGDGAVETRVIRSVPATFSHTYSQPGTYQMRVTGLGSCIGTAAATVRTTTQGTTQPVTALRFQTMDTNNDGRITREEWRGSMQSFRVHDWNSDGVLSGEEVRTGAARPRTGDPDYRPNEYVLEDWSEQRFTAMDRNRDGRITRAEWYYDFEGFLRADRNRDNVLTRAEFLNPDFDDDRGDQFDYLDLDGNNRIEQGEWHGSRQAFQWLDRNSDGVLSRSEMVGADLGTGDQFTSLDLNNDRAISLSEWQWSRASFDRLDVNNDGRLTRGEFNSAGPIGSTGASAPLRVSAQDRWTDTGIFLEAGQVVRFQASGTVQLSEDANDLADPQGARSGRRATNAPLPNSPAGALIARIGFGQPVMIGGGAAEIRVPRAGRLYLGVNDDHWTDNNGEFRVVVTVR
jgi:Ca2+-binding EF-hand superfamily protein